MRLGETCVVAATFQEARHFTPVDHPALPRPRRAHRLRLRPRRGPARRAAARPARRRAGAGRPGARRVGRRRPRPALQRGAARPRPRRRRPGPGPALRVRADLRPRRVVRAAHALLSRVAPRAALRRRSQPARTPQPSPLVHAPALPVGVADDELLHRALAATTSGVTIADMRLPDQPLIYVNAAFERARPAWPAPSVLGRNCRFLQGADTDPAAVARIRAAIDAGRGVPRDGAQPPRAASARRGGTRSTCRRCVDAAGTVVQYIGVQHDVTARVEAERALLQERDRSRAATSPASRSWPTPTR